MENYEKILQILLQIPGSVKINDCQIRMHCPVCDKKDNKLYVGLSHNPIFTNKGMKVLGYGCKQCLFSGMVGKRFFDRLGIKYDKELLNSTKISTNNNKTINTITKFQKLDLKIPNFIRPEDKFKVDYLSSRFGRSITIKDIQKYKIVLNFNDLFEFNKYDLYAQAESKDQVNKIKYLADEYTKHFVGLLSVDNNKVNLRNIDSEKFKNKRYMVYVIDKNINNPYMYMPVTQLNLLSNNPVINMAEGNYDIIGAKELYFPEDHNNMIFVAIGTRTAYKRALDQILKMTGFLNAKINIFADNDSDTDLNWYREMFKDWHTLFDNISIHYNTAVYIDEHGREKPCKDFGNLSHPVKLESYDLFGSDRL